MEWIQMSAALSGIVCLMLALYSFKRMLKTSLCACR